MLDALFIPELWPQWALPPGVWLSGIVVLLIWTAVLLHLPAVRRMENGDE